MPNESKSSPLIKSARFSKRKRKEKEIRNEKSKREREREKMWPLANGMMIRSDYPCDYLADDLFERMAGDVVGVVQQ